MDESPRKVEHAKAPAASADPAADLALVATARAQTLQDVSLFTRGTLILIGRLAAAIERLLRERDGLTAYLHERRAQCDILRAERDAALRERDDLMRRLKGLGVGNV